jgi:hypothetical protein
MRPGSTDTKEEAQHALSIEKVQALGRLELLQYVVRDVVAQRWTYGVPFAESRVLLIVYGEAVICMDFSQVRVRSQDEKVKRIEVELPEPSVCQVRVDPARSRVYNADFSLVEWWRGGEAERVRQALAGAQDSLRRNVEREFPRELARAQAETLLARLLQEAGWREVVFQSASG